MLSVFFAVAVALHHSGFHSRMIYDSLGYISQNAPIFARHDILGIMGIVPARPLFMLTLYANYLWAGMDPYGLRLVNALILAASGVAMAFLSLQIFQISTLRLPGTNGQKRAVGVLLGLWFVVHPLQSLVVLYIVQREAILGCFFYFSALAVYLAGRSGRLSRPTRTYVLTSALFLAGMLSKENVVTLPMVLLLAEMTLLRQDVRQLIRRAAIIALIALPPFVGYLVLVHGLHGPDATYTQGIWNRLSQYYQAAALTPVEVLLTESRVLFTYLGMIAAPFWIGVQLVAVQTISRSLLNPSVTLAAVAGAGVLVGLGLAMVRRQPLVAFGILFFFITLLPESTLIPQYLFCGYRAILPMAGVLLILGQGVLTVFAGSGAGAAKATTAALLVVTLGVLASVTVMLAREWDPLRVWKAAYEQLPPSSENVELTPYMDILGNLGLELSTAGQYDAAIRVLGQVVQIESKPNNFKKVLALVNMGLVQQAKGDKAGGIDSFRQAIRCDPTDALPHYHLGASLVRMGDVSGGVQALRMAAKLNPRDPETQSYLGKASMQQGHMAEAIEHYQEATRLDPGSGGIRTDLAIALEKSGDLSLAVESYRKAVGLTPDSPAFRFNLGKALTKAGQVREAIAAYQKAVELNPALGPAYANLGTLLLGSGRMPEAAESLRKALALLPENPELFYQYGVALKAAGRSAEAEQQFRKALAIKPDHAAAGSALESLGQRGK
jgi:protein O-mannosyl-transferase